MPTVLDTPAKPGEVIVFGNGFGTVPDPYNTRISETARPSGGDSCDYDRWHFSYPPSLWPDPTASMAVYSFTLRGLPAP